MSVDVLHSERSQLFRHSGTHEGMAERPDAPARRGREFSQHRLQQQRVGLTLGAEAANRLYQLGVGKRVETASLAPELTLSFSQFARPYSFAATANHAHAPLAQFADFIHHVRLDGRRELIGDVGHGGHELASSDEHSMPATVNISPVTNW